MPTEQMDEDGKIVELDEKAVISNYSGYGYNGSENFEHDDTGDIHNYSGVEDDTFSALAEHEDWEEGYDY